ncbi:6753_t:CDS:2 [Cetraspora pellucida]|uniref:6753_t:CDS:1 n=1 Tax=Cetraspora pellucida TaxID=1433469 RepID=A0A9N9AYU4_9GLOM|nr:6753_t:CDS:2 [Cetraspora pellucida]
MTSEGLISRPEFSRLGFENAIQKVKKTAVVNNDALILLTSLMQKKLENLCWVVDFKLDKDNHLHVKKAMRKASIVMFTNEDPALDTAISITHAYLYLVFTVGIESTSKVESYNWIIKQQLKVNSTLCELADRLDTRLKEECKKDQTYIEELHSKQKNNQLVYDGFIEDQYDACLIMLQTLIDEVEWKDVLEI